MAFPSLPPNPESIPWDPKIYRSYQNLASLYDHAFNMLASGNHDLFRIKHHKETVLNDGLPLLVVLDSVADEYGLSKSWIFSCGEMFVDLFKQLCEAEASTSGREDTSRIQFPKPVRLMRTGKRGRPRKVIDHDFLEHAMNPHSRISLHSLAKKLGVHRHTLRYYLIHYRLNYQFRTIPDGELDQLVRTFRRDNPASGIRYLIGYLRDMKIRVPRSRLEAAISRVDPLGRALHKRKHVTKRRPGGYQVPRPNSLWHIDGHHKLILWGIVIHGCVDGFSRAVVGIKASTNNRASTVLKMFIEAILSYGIPSRCRGDYGGENRDVSILMILLRGINRASFMWGSSTHNVRIERLWLEVGTQFARAWRGFFFRLGRLHQLNRKNPHHLWILHFLFLDEINMDCITFQRRWNAHPISGQAGHNLTPNAMRLTGMLTEGMYNDRQLAAEFSDVHPSTLQNVYGVEGNLRHRQPGHYGAGQGEDDEFTSSSDEDNTGHPDIGELDQPPHGLHKAVKVPDHRCPFNFQSEIETFKIALEAITSTGTVHSGYGINEDEWGPDGYPSFERIRSGKRGTREMVIDLPDHIWRPRSERWCRALYVFHQMMLQKS